jgi:hypothetical protein
VAIKNSVDIFYFACIAPLHIFFTEEGAMEKKTFLGTYAIHSSIICVPGYPTYLFIAVLRIRDILYGSSD